jgi:peptidylprolyl isomerase
MIKSQHIVLAIALALAAPAANAQSGSASGSDTVTTPSGLRYVITRHGTGPAPTAGSYPVVHYTGALTNGTVFDDSHQRNEPIAFKLGMGQVIKGWEEGIALLHVGDRATLIIPPAMGYGEKGAGDVIPANATLVFDVELLNVKKQSVGEWLSGIIDSKGPDAAQREYTRWKETRDDSYYLSETDINLAGYRYLNQKKFKEAIAIFKINTDLFPASGNVYDSLGEACMTAGDSKLAIANYQRSLELDPNNANAAEMLKKLQKN